MPPPQLQLAEVLPLINLVIGFLEKNIYLKYLHGSRSGVNMV